MIIGTLAFVFLGLPALLGLGSVFTFGAAEAVFIFATIVGLFLAFLGGILL